MGGGLYLKMKWMMLRTDIPGGKLGETFKIFWSKASPFSEGGRNVQFQHYHLELYVTHCVIPV